MANQFTSMPRGGGNQFGSVPGGGGGQFASRPQAPPQNQFGSRMPDGSGNQFTSMPRGGQAPPGGSGSQFGSVPGGGQMPQRPGQNQNQIGARGPMQSIGNRAPNPNASMGMQSLGGTNYDDPPAEGEVGVGLFFKERAAEEGGERRLYVQTIIPGQSAARQQVVQVGDVVVQVDGQDVAGVELPLLRNMILGEVGTFVTLKFERDEDGEMKEYSVSLMRGSTAFFQELKMKNKAQADFDELTRRIEELRKQVELMEAEDGDVKARSALDKQNLEKLRALLREAQNELAKEEATLAQEERVASQLDSEARRLRSKKEQEERQLEELRALLQQSHNKLTDANDHIQLTRTTKAETEKTWKDEQEARGASEEKDRQLTAEMERRMAEERRIQQEREQELLEIEEDRKKYERLLREVQAETDEVVRKREGLRARTERADQQRSKIQQDNDRLITMLHDAEDARATIEQAKAEAQGKSQQLEADIQGLAEQGVQRQAYVDELRSKAESERQRWEEALRVEQEGRRDDNQRYRAREEELRGQAPRLSEALRELKREAEDKKRTLEGAVMRSEQENRSVDAALKAEQSLAEALKERIAVLGDQLAKTEAEVQGSAEGLGQAQAASGQAETDKLKALERERAMDAELQREKDGEGEKLASLEELRQTLEEQRVAKEEAVYGAMAEERKEAVAKEEAEHALRRHRDDGQRMVDDERRRLEREAAFKRQHGEYVEQLEEAMALEDAVRGALDKVSLPAKELALHIESDFIFDDTAPRLAKLPDAVDGPAPAPAPPPPPVMQAPPPVMVQAPPVSYVQPSHTYQLLSQPAPYQTGRSMDNGSYI